MLNVKAGIKASRQEYNSLIKKAKHDDAYKYNQIQRKKDEMDISNKEIAKEIKLLKRLQHH